MRMLSNIITALFLLSLLAFAGCSDKVSSSLGADRGNPAAWLIPSDQVLDGGPGRDGIPSVDRPNFVLAGDASNSYLSDFDLVVGIKVGNVVRAYPHPILDWHEIINDKISGNPFAITYCPLTGSAVAWNRVLNGSETTFGVSGLLYNTNLIPYDRATQSNWSQMKLLCVNGDLKGDTPELLRIVETTWRTWKEMYPTSEVVSTNTGFSRPYDRFPYGNYRTNDSLLLFPVANDDSRLPRKERVLGLVVNDKSIVYRLTDFSDSVTTFNHTFNGMPVVAAGSNGRNLAVVFSRKLTDGTVLTFGPVQGLLPVIMESADSTRWDVFGNAVSGPRLGQRLITTTSFISYWFAWGAFYIGSDIYSK